MIEIKYEPRKKVIIHEYAKYDSSEDLVEASVKGLPLGTVIAVLSWVDGVLLSFTASPINQIITKELLHGRLHWDHVSFAAMPEYRDQIMTANGITVSVMDVSNNPVFRAIAKFIKARFLTK